jgi:hypothetical protein
VDTTPLRFNSSTASIACSTLLFGANRDTTNNRTGPRPGPSPSHLLSSNVANGSKSTPFRNTRTRRIPKPIKAFRVDSDGTQKGTPR